MKNISNSWSSIGHWEESCGNVVVPFNNKGYRKKYQSVVERRQVKYGQTLFV